MPAPRTTAHHAFQGWTAIPIHTKLLSRCRMAQKLSPSMSRMDRGSLRYGTSDLTAARFCSKWLSQRGFLAKRQLSSGFLQYFPVVSLHRSCIFLWFMSKMQSTARKVHAGDLIHPDRLRPWVRKGWMYCTIKSSSKARGDAPGCKGNEPMILNYELSKW